MSEKDDEAAVLAANALFYAAFVARDATAMDNLWAREHPVACVHPGWDALRGRDAVMRSWRGILTSGGAPDLVFEKGRVWLLGTAAFVIGYERIRGVGNALVVTNTFVREGAAWKLVHHQASPMEGELEEDDASDKRTLN